jgi:biotin carboxylase
VLVGRAARANGDGREHVVFVPRLGWRAGPWACRSLARAGYRVIAGEDETAVANRTRFSSLLVRHPPSMTQPDAFVDAVADLCAKREVSAVLPLDDEVVHLFASRLPRPGGAVVVGPTIEQYRSLCDKSTLAILAQDVGLSYPDHVLVGRDGPRGRWPAVPCLVKPRSSGVAGGGGLVTLKPVLARSEGERDAAVEKLVGLVGEVLVEEQVRGDAWRVHFVRGHETRTVAFRSIRNYPLQTGQSSVLRAANAPAGLAAAATRLLDLVDYRGPGSIQLIERAGEFFVHDVNLRLPVTVGATISAGFDMPRIAVDEALGRGSPFQRVSTRKVTYVSLLGEAQHLRDGLRGRETGAPLRTIVSDLVLAAILPGRILDPFNVRDPLAIGYGFAEIARRRARARRVIVSRPDGVVEIRERTAP